MTADEGRGLPLILYPQFLLPTQMISREQFNHQLQTGKVRSALASVLQSLHELEITTQLATDGADRSNSTDRPYFRTKIDLLGGRIVDEVSANFADGDDRYLQLQRSHVERVAASYDLARDYLERIESLLAALPIAPTDRDRPIVAPPDTCANCDAVERNLVDETHTAGIGAATPANSLEQKEFPADMSQVETTPCVQAAPSSGFHPLLGETHAVGDRSQMRHQAEISARFGRTERPTIAEPKSPPPALVAKLQQARASLTSRLSSDIAPAMLFPSRSAAAAATGLAHSETADCDDESGEMTIVLENPPVADGGLSAADLAAVTTIVDEEIDLAIALSADYANEENGELWAGWVEEDSEDEDEYSLAALSPHPPTNPTLLDWQEIPTPKYVDPIEVKPIIPRSIARSLDPIDQWDKFEPDYLGIDFDPYPAIKNYRTIDN